MPKVPSSVPNPAEFPLGSLQSRAAARAMVEERQLPDFQVCVWVPSQLLQGQQPTIGGNLPEIVVLPCDWTEEQWVEFFAQEPPGKLRLWRAFLTRGNEDDDYFRGLLTLLDHSMDSTAGNMTTGVLPGQRSSS